MDMTMQAMSYWSELPFSGNSGGFFLVRLSCGYCVDFLQFVSVVFINKLTFWPVVYIYMVFIIICTCIFFYAVPIDFHSDAEAVVTLLFFKSTSFINAAYIFMRLRIHADRRPFNAVLLIVTLIDVILNLIQALQCYWIILY
jgi:hypothetical protein